MAFDKDKLLAGIKKSGFLLENRVSALLKQNGWNVIQNRYYIDDVNGTEREIDMIAYMYSPTLLRIYLIIQH